YFRATNRAIVYLYLIRTYIIKYSSKLINRNKAIIHASNTAYKDNSTSKKSIKGFLFKLFSKLIN
ncbi:hypothetical protein K432DRAFT_315016, partial [Lepidopterella palustris CBS 459.81]